MSDESWILLLVKDPSVAPNVHMKMPAINKHTAYRNHYLIQEAYSVKVTEP